MAFFFSPIHDIADSFRSAICSILPAFHALTGCDTVSSLFGVGKTIVMKLVKKLPRTDIDHLKALSEDDENAAVLWLHYMTQRVNLREHMNL